MIISWLLSEPLIFLAWILAVIITLTIHEFAHAATALYYGDTTAKDLGRLTLNPWPHLDMLGLFMLIFVGFGWAKPVPVNPYGFKKNPRLAMAMVSLAGPLTNLLAVIVFSLAVRFMSPIFGPTNLLINFLFMLTLVNMALLVFNLIPIPPLDGSKVLFAILPSRFDEFKYRLSVNGPWILLVVVLADNFLNLGIFSSLFNFIFKILMKIIG